MRGRLHVARLGRGNQRGSFTVELALVLPIFLLIAIGMIDAGRMIFSKTMLTYAVTVGARTGIGLSATTTAAVQTAVINAAPMLKLTTSNVTAVTTNAASWSARTRGNTVTVTATYTFTPVAPGFTKLANKTFTYTCKMTIP